MNWDKL